MKTTRFLQLQLKYVHFIILLTGRKLYINFKVFQDFTVKTFKEIKWKDTNKWICLLDYGTGSLKFFLFFFKWSIFICLIFILEKKTMRQIVKCAIIHCLYLHLLWQHFSCINQSNSHKYFIVPHYSSLDQSL